MRIISQNRQVSVEFGNGMVKTDSLYIFFNTEQSEETLGFYKTPERVREVFEEIHTIYNPLNSLNFVDGAPKEGNVLQFISTIASNGDVNVILNNNFVYYMPEE